MRSTFLIGWGLLSVLPSLVHRVQADEPRPHLRRWAIVASADVRQSGLADLLTAALTERKEIELVERDRLDAAIRELKVASLLGAAELDSRLKFGKLVGADILILLSLEERSAAVGVPVPGQQPSQNRPTLRWLISECDFGTRLHAENREWQPQHVDQLANQLAEITDEVRQQFSQGIRRVVAVSPFISRDFVHTYDYLQAGFQRVAEAALLAQEGVAVLETAEASALATELQRTAGETRFVPAMLFVEGEFRSDTKDERSPRFNVSVTVRNAERELRKLSFDKQTESQIAEGLVERIVDAVRKQGRGGEAKPRNRAAQAKLLSARAKSFEEIGDLSAALGLREAASLLAPDAWEPRVMAISHWRNLARRDWRIGPQSPAFAAYQQEFVPKLLNRWSHVRRHVHELMSRRLVNFREAARLNHPGREMFSDVRQLYPSQQQPEGLADYQTVVSSITSFYEDQALLGKSLSADIANGQDRVGHHLLDFATADTDSWNARQQRDAWLSSLIEAWADLDSDGAHPGVFLVGGNQDAGRRDSAAGRKAIAHTLRVLRDAATEDDPPCAAMVCRVLPGISLAGVRMKSDFVLVWNNDAWMKDDLLNDEQIEQFASALTATERRTNIFYADCLRISRKMARTTIYNHDRQALPKVEELLKLAQERQYGEDVIGRLKRIKVAVVELADVADRYRAMRKSPPVARSEKRRPPVAPQLDYCLEASDWPRRRDPNPRVRFVPLEGPRADWRGMVPCGEKLDIMWRLREVLAMRTAGRVESIYTLTDPEATIHDLKWDGENLWVVTPLHGIYVLDTKGALLAHIPFGEDLPLPVIKAIGPSFLRIFETKIYLEPLEPGRALIAGNHGPKGRLFVAFVERDEAGKFRSRVVHSAVKVTKQEAEAALHDDVDLAFSVGWLLPHIDPKSGRRQVLVGRLINPDPHVHHPRPLTIDARSGEASLYSAELRHVQQRPGSDINAISVDGKVFLAANQRVTRYDSTLNAATRDFGIVTVGGANDCRFDRPQVLRAGNYLYFPGDQWGRIDLATAKFEQLTRAPLPIHHNYGLYAVSSHYGLVAWNNGLPSDMETSPGSPVQFNAYNQSHIGTLFQVRIDKPVEPSVELEVIPEPYRMRHAKAAERLRKLGGHLAIADWAPWGLSTLVVLTDKWTGQNEDLRLIGELYQPAQVMLHGGKFGNDALSIIGTVESLRYLGVHDTACTDDGLSQLAKLPQLRTLQLRGPTGWEFSTAGFKHLENTLIGRLELSGKGIDDVVLEQLNRHKALTSIILDDHSVTREALLERDKQLKERFKSKK